MTKTLILTVAALAAAAGPLGAQTPAAPAAPAKMIRIYREQLKPGKAAAHERFEAGYVQAFTRAGAKTHYLALTTMTGSPEAWYVEGHDSFEALAAADKAVEGNAALTAELESLSARDADFLNNSQTIVARYREDLSYRASPPNLNQARFMWVYRETVKSGYGNEYTQAGKMFVAAYEKAGIKDERWAAYQVMAGLPNGTILYFQPLNSLKESDIDNSKAFREAAGDDNNDRMRQINREAIVPGSGQSTIFAMSPKMSYVSKEFAAVDPDYWMPKPKPAAKMPAKADAPKP